MPEAHVSPSLACRTWPTGDSRFLTGGPRRWVSGILTVAATEGPGLRAAGRGSRSPRPTRRVPGTLGVGGFRRSVRSLSGPGDTSSASRSAEPFVPLRPRRTPWPGAPPAESRLTPLRFLNWLITLTGPGYSANGPRWLRRARPSLGRDRQHMRPWNSACSDAHSDSRRRIERARRQLRPIARGHRRGHGTWVISGAGERFGGHARRRERGEIGRGRRLVPCGHDLAEQDERTGECDEDVDEPDDEDRPRPTVAPGAVEGGVGRTGVPGRADVRLRRGHGGPVAAACGGVDDPVRLRFRRTRTADACGAGTRATPPHPTSGAGH
jgi:hypothetical protein